MAICKLCRHERQLCDSHIVPEFVYAPLYDEGRKLIGFRFGRGSIKSHLLQKGLREFLLCAACEQLLNHDYEQPNVDLWRRLAAHEREIDAQWEAFATPAGASGVYVKGVDYSSFKLFLLSMLWRASVSDRQEFKAVQLGPHEEPIRRMLLQGDPGAKSDYPCIVFLFREPGVILPPIRQRVAGHLMYHFILTTVQIWFLVSRHISQEPIVGMALSEEGSFPAILMDPRETKLFGALTEIERETEHSTSVLRRLERK
jgi:hypothetical protein